MASSQQRPTTVNLILGLLGVGALYGLYLANELRPLVTSGVIEAMLPGGAGILITVAVVAIAIASLGMLWALWQTIENRRETAFAWASRSTIAWTLGMAGLAISPFVLGSALQSAALEEAVAAQTGDPLGALGLGSVLMGGFASDLIMPMLQRAALTRAGIPALVGAFAVYQLNKNAEVNGWFGRGVDPGGDDVEVIEIEKEVIRTPPPEPVTLAPPSTVAVAQLVRMRRGQPVSQHEITTTGSGKKLVIGRDRRQSQIAIKDDPTVSRTHAAFIVDDNRVYIEDLASQWGVEVNGSKILKRQLLFHDDRIQLGDSEFVFMQAGKAT